ncbi:DUF1580 domain-containing protein [Botrimarina mediterranea]|uniref:DUF1580 domain-containing protein n=1 Tax=Botrimarina mediterranea TaxID=2528022 RepID=A0A518K7M7_9BACT|nr:DUF1580 domain-containing protein [Botrimarina mediterranea]QDV73804.1 hypothetical protein Spa11_20030 [Botrimarina mediterranea]
MKPQSLNGEQLVSLQEVPDYLPTRRGKKVHITTIYRWVLKGVRGKVLESALLGGIRYTSLEALQRFLGTTTTNVQESHRKAQIDVILSNRGLTMP